MSTSQQAEHTHAPGPWRSDGAFIYASYEGGRIAEVSRYRRPEGESTATAALICAAPDLLEAAKNYILAVDAYYRNDPSPETIEDKCVDLVIAHEKLEAAIAKAEGAK